jgi:ribosomal protein S18 acetylase RimI-like enzyme
MPDEKAPARIALIDDIRIVPTAEKYIAGFNAAVDLVARERLYLGLVEAPPMEVSRAFILAIMNGGGVQQLAVTADDQVVGWCDIIRNGREGFRHAGYLGMGLLPAYRGQGLGRRLAQAAIDAAIAAGMDRIELDVLASNARGLALYQRLGFVTEGVQLRARVLDGRVDDNICMALLVSAPPTASSPPSTDEAR